MAKKKTELEELDLDEDEEEEEPEELEDTEDKSTTVKKELEGWIKNANLKLDLQEKAITTNQKYIKKLWQRIKELEENFTMFINSK